jgi:hypothetical protein
MRRFYPGIETCSSSGHILPHFMMRKNMCSKCGRISAEPPRCERGIQASGFTKNSGNPEKGMGNLSDGIG